MTIPNRWSVSPDEQAELSAALDERRQHQPEIRHLMVSPPAAADMSFEGAFRWTLGVLWQDRPAFLVFGIFCGVAAIIL